MTKDVGCGTYILECNKWWHCRTPTFFFASHVDTFPSIEIKGWSFTMLILVGTLSSGQNKWSFFPMLDHKSCVFSWIVSFIASWPNCLWRNTACQQWSLLGGKGDPKGGYQSTYTPLTENYPHCRHSCATFCPPPHLSWRRKISSLCIHEKAKTQKNLITCPRLQIYHVTQTDLSPANGTWQSYDKIPSNNFRYCPSIIPITVVGIVRGKHNIREKGFILVPTPGYSPSWRWSHGSQDIKQLVTAYPQSRVQGDDE